MKQYSATIGGVTKSLLEWGFNEGQMQTSNQAADTVTLLSALPQLALDDLVPFDSVVDIYRADVRIFSGRCVPAISAAGAKRSSIVKLDGAWAELESRQCLQLWVSSATDTDPLGEALFGRIQLNVDPTLFDPLDPPTFLIKTDDAVRKVLEWAISKGAPLQIGTIDPGPQAPSETVQDAMNSDVITRLLRWTPGAVVYFDYSTSPTTIHVRQPSAIPAVTMPITAFEQLPKIQRSWRQIVNAVYMTYHTQTFDGVAWASSFKPPIQWPPAGPSVPQLGERGAILFSLDENDASDYSDATLARMVYEAYQSMQWSVEGLLHGEDVPTGVRVGQALNISGSRAAWASMGTLVQRTTDDFKKGTRKVECGAPRTLTGRDLLSLLMPNRRRKPFDFNLAQQQATGSSGGYSAGSDGSNQGQDSGGRPPGSSLQTFEGVTDDGSGPRTAYFTGYLTKTG